jgi:hypothetical protein
MMLCYEAGLYIKLKVEAKIINGLFIIYDLFEDFLLEDGTSGKLILVVISMLSSLKSLDVYNLLDRKK